MKKDAKSYLELEYEFDGCGDYDKPIVYSEQSKNELKIILDRKNKIDRILNRRNKIEKK